jgi:inner membrane protein
MDIVHHGVIAAAGMVALTVEGHVGPGVAFAAASVLPDADVAMMALGKRAYLKNHQAATHSIPFLIIMALALGYLLQVEQTFAWNVPIAAFIGLLLHILLDLSNTYGIAVFWPISKKRFSLDAIFFIDTVAWGMTVSLSVLAYLLKASWVFYLLLPFMFLYVVFKYFLRLRVKSRLKCDYIIPEAFNPFGFFVVKSSPGSAASYWYNALTGKESHRLDFPAPDALTLELAGKSQLYKDMQKVARCLYITDVQQTQDGTKVIASDIAVRNFGGKFARTTLKFNQQGELISEAAEI